MRAVVVGSGDPVDPELLKERCQDGYLSGSRWRPLFI